MASCLVLALQADNVWALLCHFCMSGFSVVLEPPMLFEQFLLTTPRCHCSFAAAVKCTWSCSTLQAAMVWPVVRPISLFALYVNWCTLHIALHGNADSAA